MSGRVLQLNTAELVSALHAVDAVDLLAEELRDGVTGKVGDDMPDGRIIQLPGPDDLVLLDDQRVGRRCVLPARALAASRMAALATIAVRALVTPGAVTAAVLGPGSATSLLLPLILGRAGGLSHVAIFHGAGASSQEHVQPQLLAELDRAGVGWTVTEAAADAVFGATLVVGLVPRPDRLDIGVPASGALLINTARVGFAGGVVDQVRQIYVDDASLSRPGDPGRSVAYERTVDGDIAYEPSPWCVDSSPEETWLAPHGTHPSQAAAGARRFGGLWPRRRRTGRPGRSSRGVRPIEAELGQLLTGEHAGRTGADDILLVDLLGAWALDVRLACTLHRVALSRGFGVQRDEWP
ncbi:hypothetical protein O7621_13470 [Solwaraspora sp. WMMD937]|uniref:hypothetical protein n=1 Tax=Solwaraspora sp. WMMD937 TaxID=3016090 RepID=UPI002499F9F1|nr:hypothetical protein [Solwaraspora sp. WMMD937]WFE24178.1 hypothetical protein O7621_13470 [Solwaraspora sp. WMMD937]